MERKNKGPDDVERDHILWGDFFDPFDVNH